MPLSELSPGAGPTGGGAGDTALLTAGNGLPAGPSMQTTADTGLLTEPPVPQAGDTMLLAEPPAQRAERPIFELESQVMIVHSDEIIN